MPLFVVLLYYVLCILSNGLLLCLEDLWLSAFPAGTSIYNTFLSCIFGLTFKACLFLSCHLPWENIDKIKVFNWNFENVYVEV